MADLVEHRLLAVAGRLAWKLMNHPPCQLFHAGGRGPDPVEDEDVEAHVQPPREQPLPADCQFGRRAVRSALARSRTCLARRSSSASSLPLGSAPARARDTGSDPSRQPAWTRPARSSESPPAGRLTVLDSRRLSGVRKKPSQLVGKTVCSDRGGPTSRRRRTSDPRTASPHRSRAPRGPTGR